VLYVYDSAISVLTLLKVVVPPAKYAFSEFPADTRYARAVERDVTDETADVVYVNFSEEETTATDDGGEPAGTPPPAIIAKEKFPADAAPSLPVERLVLAVRELLENWYLSTLLNTT
jgi:hypothetical protein